MSVYTLRLRFFSIIKKLCFQIFTSFTGWAPGMGFQILEEPAGK
jgi:hypothetical protein